MDYDFISSEPDACEIYLRIRTRLIVMKVWSISCICLAIIVWFAGAHFCGVATPTIFGGVNVVARQPMSSCNGTEFGSRNQAGA